MNFERLGTYCNYNKAVSQLISSSWLCRVKFQRQELKILLKIQYMKKTIKNDIEARKKMMNKLLKEKRFYKRIQAMRNISLCLMNGGIINYL
jgi:hypothetical protein